MEQSGAPGAAPLPPEFSEPIEMVRERIAKAIGKATVPSDVRIWHPAIDVVGQPAVRHTIRAQTSAHSQLPFYRCGEDEWETNDRGREAREIHLTFHKQHVGITLDPPKQYDRRGQVVTTSASTSDGKLALSILEASAEAP